MGESSVGPDLVDKTNHLVSVLTKPTQIQGKEFSCLSEEGSTQFSPAALPFIIPFREHFFIFDPFVSFMCE